MKIFEVQQIDENGDKMGGYFMFEDWKENTFVIKCKDDLNIIF